MRTVPLGWKVTHVKTTMGKWGTDVTFVVSGRTLKFTGKLSSAHAVAQASKYLRDELTLYGHNDPAVVWTPETARQRVGGTFGS